MTGRWLLILLLLRCAPAGAAPAPAADILDIRGPLSPGDLPPFALTLAGLVLAGGITLAWSGSGRRREPEPRAATPAGPDEPLTALQRLAHGVERGELGAPELAQRLADLLRAGLAGGAASRLTTEELLAHPEVASLLGPVELEGVAQLLGWCDRVKFAGEPSRPGEMAPVLESALRLLVRVGEARREVS